ncbi:MAG: hypothetical protein ACYSWQ_01365 [Planctomycetota bacterium]|jgi:hypothetical protein
MLWKNGNERVGVCLTVVTSCLVMAALWAVLATPDTALAKKPVKPPGGGGGGETGQLISVGIAFDGTEGYGIKNDGDVYIDGELKGKVTAVVGRNFNIVLGTNNSNKRTAGRTLWLDLSNRSTCDASVKVDVSDGAGGDVDGICDDCLDSVPDLPAARFGTLPSGQKSGYPDSATLKIRGRDLDGLLYGNTVDTSAQMNFSVGGQSWVLYWGPHKVPGGWTYAPGTGPVTVYRYDNNTWIITSTGDACLYRDNNPPHRATEYHGQVNVPFVMTAVAMVHEETIWGDEPHGIVLGDDPCSEQ